MATESSHRCLLISSRSAAFTIHLSHPFPSHMALMQAIPMVSDSTLGLTPGVLHDGVPVSVVDLPSSSLRPPVETFKMRLNGDYPTRVEADGDLALSRRGKSSTSFVQHFPRPIRGAAGRLQGALSTLSIPRRSLLEVESLSSKDSASTVAILFSLNYFVPLRVP